MVSSAAAFFALVAAPDRHGAARGRKPLRVAQANAAIAAGDDRDAARQIEHAHRFSVPRRVLVSARAKGTRPSRHAAWTIGPAKSNGCLPPRFCPYDRHHTNPQHRTERGNDAIQTLHARHRLRLVATLKLDHQEVMNAVSADMLGGLQEALQRDRQQEGRGPLRRADRRRPRVLHRRQSVRPQRPEGRPRKAAPSRSSRPAITRSCAACATCTAR